MSKAIHIDFVSDVVCPWCAVGLGALQQAIANLGDEVAVTLAFKPFELNPDMPPEGQDIVEHIQQKYGSTPEQVAANREHIRQRGAEVGFRFDMQARGRIYNTFDAHRLLHWAGLEGRQLALKQGLLAAYFSEGATPATAQCWWTWPQPPGWTPRRRARCWSPAASPRRCARKNTSTRATASARCRR